MKKLIFILICTPAMALGPKYSYQDPKLNDEFVNVYYNIGKKNVNSATKSELQLLTPIRPGRIYYCSDCTTDAICVSTGTTIGAFSRVSSRTTSCT